MATNNAINVATAATGKILRAQGIGTAPAFSTATYPDTAGTSENVLTSDGTNFVSSAPAASSLVTTFLSNGSWTLNSKTKIVEFFVWGAGGGGGSGRAGTSATAGGGAGGGPGSFVYMTTSAALLTGSPYTITIGTGGTGGNSVNGINVNGNPGIVGGTTSIGTMLVAPGGSPGAAGSTGTVTAGTGLYYNLFSLLVTLSGGNGTATVGTTATSPAYGWATGGGGGGGYTAATPRVGGAGGSIVDPAATVLVAGGLAGANTGATAGNGNPPTGQQLLIGGTGGGGGGVDGVTTAGTGGNGAQPGGGGGGGAGNLSTNASGAGGNGGDGKVVIFEYF